MLIDLNNLGFIGKDTLESLSNVNGLIPLESTSKELSPLQKEYRRFFEGQLAEHGFEKSPFEGTVDQTQQFFSDLSTRWKTRRAEFEQKNGEQE